ncbi:ATP-dependent translocase ABCB1-like [Xenia sp. Carnegie-2017]|uniref:ATP-dependent translocase ABCB1-like n=1 Tax=Xenia sp. Carnegie-2017 TaxID=2897299 RepID=UPI001F03A671|nr:ATP-dependent translocase ABCB1-like [Xenia sp. Carnegie-2017]
MADGVEPTEKSPLLSSSDDSRSNKIPDVSVKSGKSEIGKSTNMVPFTKLFDLADKLDVFLMIIGTIGAIVFGGMQPGQFIIFGSLTDDFVEFGRCKLSNCSSLPDIEESTRKIAYWYVGIAHVFLFSGYMMMAGWGISSERQNHKIRLAVFRSILRQDIAWFDYHDAGELNSRLVDDLNKIVDGMGEKFARFIQCLTTFIGAYIIGFIYGWQLTLVLLSMLPLMAFGGGIMGLLSAGFTAQEVNAYAKAGSIAEEVLSSMRTVAAFGGEEKETKRYEERLANASEFGVKKGLAMGCGMGFLQFVVFASYTLAFWYGSKLVIQKDMSSGDMMTVFFSVVTGSIVLGQIGPNLQAMATSRAASYNIFAIIDREPVVDALTDEGLKPEKMDANVEFRNVKFRYPTRPDLKVLRGFNLTIPQGKTAALVGGSGCGKSTVVKILQRFYSMTSGTVTIGGDDIKALNLKWLRSHIGVVSQEPILFATTIADNISYGREGATMDEIIEVAKKANAHSFITQFPQGYQTLCGERGAQMSGGQKQRIAIARALIRNPKILLLDEATSALDTESESIVQDALDKASEGRTTIVIAHRLSTIKNADMIVSVDKGRVSEIGTHDELMAAGGIYKDLVTLQMLAAEQDKQVEPEDVDDDGEENAVDLKLSLSSSGSVQADVRYGRQLSRQLSRRSMGQADIVLEEDVKPAPIFSVIKLNFPEWKWMAIGCIGSALTGAFPFVLLSFWGNVLQHNRDDPHEREIMKDDSLKWALFFLVIGVATGIGMILQNWMFAKAGEKLTTRLRKKAFAAMLRQEIGFFDDINHSTGALCTQLSSHASKVQGATGPTVGLAVSSLVTAVGSLIVAYISGWKLALVITGFVPFIIVAGSLSMLLMGSKDRYGGDEESGQIAIETISNMQTVASLGREELFYERYVKVAERHYYFFNVYFSTVLMSIIMGSLMIGQLAALSPDFNKGRIGAAHLFKLFARVPKIDSASDKGIKPNGVEGNIQFRKVKFRYPARRNVKVLRGLNFSVKSGETLALVGSSGCGKSTSVSLIERFYNPESGLVTLDDNDINALNIKWLRNQIGIVSQEPILFDLTIRENIAYGDNTREVSIEEIQTAAKNANIHDFITSLTNGYETKVGDKGTLISGGQKQRIAIARALVRNPKILLLDEATSALDTESEKIVQDALDKAREGRTTLVIAHRLSTIQNADCIVVLRKGRVIEQGTHQQLINKKGAYYVLQKAQALGSEF